MSIGLKRPFTDEERECCEVPLARLCESCQNVTKLERCFACDATTVPHPEILEQPKYCIRCGDQQPDERLRVITFENNPYEQDGEGGLCCSCLNCLNCLDDEG